MRTSALVTAAALACAGTAPTIANAQPIQFLPRQTILACPNNNVQTPGKGWVCSRNILVGGGRPLSGYTFTVTPGSTLPKGTFLISLTGVITAQSATSILPAAGARLNIPITVHDTRGTQASSRAGTIMLVVQRPGTNPCGCPIFQVSPIGPLPPAKANRPYAVTLPVVGPSSATVLRPVYSWRIASGRLPAGLVLDMARGVVRGTPLSSAAGRNHTFKVAVKETRTKTTAFVPGNFTLFVQP